MTAEAGIEATGQPAKAGKLKLMLIIGAAALVVVVGGGVGFMMMSSGQPATAAAHGAGDAHGTSDGHGGAGGADTFIFNLPPMTVNLNSDGEADSFMKLSIALEVADASTMELIQPRMAKVIDAFQVYLRELRKSDLDGSAGIYRLKEELLRRINVAIAPAQVEAILFKEILVQ